MARTLLTSIDVKNIIEELFNGEANAETAVLTNEATGEQTETDIAKYLNIGFYSWKNRVVEKGNGYGRQEYADFDAWLQSLNLSLNQAYALVELTNEEVTASQDIDSATKNGRVTFIIQANKVAVLDYFVSKIKNNLLGNPVEMRNAFGETIKTYTVFGTLTYDQEPTETQIGECIIASCTFSIVYLNDALSWADTKFELSLTGDNTYDADGNIVGTDKFLEIPLSKVTWQNVYTSQAVPTIERPDLTGFCATNLTCVKTFTFYDFNKELASQFNTLFLESAAYRIDGVEQTARDVNIPVYVRVTNGGHTYIYKDMVDTMQKVYTNGDFTLCSLTLKGYGKLGG